MPARDAVGGPLIGAQVPAFSGPDQHGGLLSDERLRGMPALIVFFPFAFTGVCGDELGELSAATDAGILEGVPVWAISCDAMASQRAWAAERGFAFDLISDFWPHGRIARAFSIFDEDAGRPERGSFLIDARGILRWSLLHPPGKARPVAAYRQAIREHLGAQ